MISFTTLKNTFGSLSQNNSAANLALGAQLMNIEQKYLLQKYFSNEGTYSLSTVGSQSLTLTATPAIGDIEATLTTAWTEYTTTAWFTFSSGENRLCDVEKGSTKIYWDMPLDKTATTAVTVGGLQFYPAPPNFSKLKTVTITIGNLKWTPTEILSRQDWDKLNVFPYYADIPNNFFIYPGGDKGVQIGIWPIPSTTGNTLTYNYKFRIPDLSLEDYSTGTVSITQGSTTVTGTGTSFTVTTNPGSESRWIQIAQPDGDNLWYQVASVDSATQITLFAPYQGIDVSGGSYVLGQMPILMEDFHDMLIWKALTYYFSSIVDNPNKFKEYKDAYDSKLELLSEYAGSNTVNVNLGRRPTLRNPNLYPQSLG